MCMSFDGFTDVMSNSDVMFGIHCGIYNNVALLLLGLIYERARGK